MFAVVNPLFLGVWLLRATNDYNFKESTTLLEIKEDCKLELFTKFNDGIFGKTFKRIGYISEPPKYCLSKIDLFFTKKILFSYSILGFKIPEAAKTYYTYDKPKRFKIKREGNTIIVNENKSKLFYIFDLYVKEYNTPPIETRWNNFIFIQIVSFLLNIILVQFLNYSSFETNEILNNF